MSSTRKRLETLTAGLILPPADTAPRAEQAAVASEPTPPSAPETVETRFPPALTGMASARTGPGQMLAFRGQMQQVEGELTALRERLRQYDGSQPTLKIDPKTIRPSRWANRHEASFKTSEFAGLKADIAHAGGNIQPILVRPLKDVPGQYELVFGHRRHRAALELGIAVLALVWTDALEDAALFAAMDRENRERADLSNYEQGVMYQRALEEHLFPSQRQLAESLGVSHTWVRKALNVAQLPTAVVECFRSPLDITHRHAEQINAAMDKDRRGVLKRVERLRGSNLSATQLVARLIDGGAEGPQGRLQIHLAGKPIGSLKRGRAGDLSITLSAQPATTADLESLISALREAIQKARGSI